MMGTGEQPGADFLRKHLGHEVKYFVFAAMEFRRPEAERYAVPLHDSALVRGRTLLDFLNGKPSPDTVAFAEFLDPNRLEDPPRSEPAGRWFGFVSDRRAHLGRRRDPPDDFDQWPDRAPGEPKGDDRLDRLAALVVDLLRDRARFARPDCRPVLEVIAQRAAEYLAHPTDERLDRMDPTNL